MEILFPLIGKIKIYLVYNFFSIQKFFLKNGIDVLEDEVRATFKRLDTDRDARVTFSEFKRIFTGALGGTANSNGFSKSSTFYESKGSRGFSDSPKNNSTLKSPLRSSLRSPVRSPLRSSLRSPVRSPLGLTANRMYTTNRYTSPLREKTLNILEKSQERINRSFVRSPEALRNSSNLVNSSNTGFRNTSNISYRLSYEEENFLLYLKELLDIENEIEKAKCDVISKSDFNAEDAFGIFELDRRGYLSNLDVKYGLNAMEIFPNQEDVNLLLKRHDYSGEGVLR